MEKEFDLDEESLQEEQDIHDAPGARESPKAEEIENEATKSPRPRQDHDRVNFTATGNQEEQDTESDHETDEGTEATREDMEDAPSETLKELEKEEEKEIETTIAEEEEHEAEKEEHEAEETQEEEEGIELDISVDDVSEDLLSDRAAGLLAAEDEAEEEILFKEEEWIPPLTRWSKLRRYFAQFSLLRGTLIIILLLMASFTTITYFSGQSINNKLNQGLQELNIGLEQLQGKNFLGAREHFSSAEDYFRTARTETDVYRFSLLLNLPVTVFSYVFAPEILQGADKLPTITDGLTGMSQAYAGLSASLDLLTSSETNPYAILTSTSDVDALAGVLNKTNNVLVELLNFVFLAEQQKEKHLKQLETNIGEFLKGHLKEFYQAFSLTAKQLDDQLSMYRIGFEVTVTLLKELSLALKIIEHVNQQNWALAKSLIPDLENLNKKNLIDLGRLNSEVTDIDDSWFAVPMKNTLRAVATWINETASTIDERPANAFTLISEALINQVLLELKPISDIFIQTSQ